MRRRILLTGATGALGQALLPELLDRGFEVLCLIRPRKNQSAADRLAELTMHPCAVALDGDITAAVCGLDPSSLPAIDKIVHAAADTRLDQRDAASVLESNLTGTRHVIDLANALGRPEVHYVGTAYIAGDGAILHEQERDEPLRVGAARNPYEASKVKAELLVRGYRGHFSVQRPSIVVGRSDDGSAPQLEGWYGFFRTLTQLRAMIARGNYQDEHGRRIGPGHRLKLAIGIQDADDVALNLVQLDWMARTQAALIALPACGRTYNLTHPRSLRLKELLAATMEALDLNHVTFVPDTAGWTISPIKLAIRRMVRRELEHLRPYLVHSPEFVSRNLYADLGAGWPEPPAITADYIRMTMRAAERTWTGAPALAASEPRKVKVR
jgi:nucleoside-diphosphate-sugar epimerase